tara:strand:+ start:83 stop:283 length:201 start_codon:yes stop_codon:yes gene_type:complete
MDQTVNNATRQEKFLKSDLCEGIKRCYVASSYRGTDKHPTEEKLNLYLQRVYNHFVSSGLLEDFNL